MHAHPFPSPPASTHEYPCEYSRVPLQVLDYFLERRRAALRVRLGALHGVSPRAGLLGDYSHVEYSQKLLGEYSHVEYSQGLLGEYLQETP